MPRASNGVYSLPAGNPVVTGTTIASTWANTTLADMATAMTDSLDRSGFGGMLASLQLFSGTAGSPGLSWSVETNSGLYRAGASDFRYSIAGTDVLKLTTNQLLVGGTTAPGFTAVLGAMAAGSVNVSVHNTTNAIETLLSATGTGGAVGAFTNHPFEIRTNNTQRINITSGGNVTINAAASGINVTIGAAYGGTSSPTVGIATAGGTGNFLGSYDGTHEAMFGTFASGGFAGTITSHEFDIRTANTARLVISSAGQFTLNTPSGGTTAKINGVTGNSGFTGNSPFTLTIGPSGADSVDYFGIDFTDTAVPKARIGAIFGGGGSSLVLGTSNNYTTGITNSALTVGPNGSVVIAAPSAGTALSISGAAGQDVLDLLGNSTSNGLFIASGSTSSHNALLVRNAAQTVNCLLVRSDGVVQAPDDAGNLQTVGWRDMPQNTQNVNYQFVMSDRGKTVAGGSGTLTYTIPANASVAFPTGTVITIVNVTGNNMTIAITTDTLVWAGAGTTGSRTLSNNGVATILKYSPTAWMIMGSGLS